MKNNIIAILPICILFNIMFCAPGSSGDTTTAADSSASTTSDTVQLSIDLNGDGVSDGILIDINGDQIPDGIDTNSDGVIDISFSGTGITVDMNGDGIPDATLIDINGDGIPDGLDTNGDGIIDSSFSIATGNIDINGDGIPDGVLIDINGDGLADGIDTNSDGSIDVLFTIATNQIDINGDGTPDGVLIDSNGDGYADGLDTNGDGIIDSNFSIATGNIDINGDGIPDGVLIDINGDGLADGIDTNNDGSIDVLFTMATGQVDVNGDGIPDGVLIDSNGDGYADGLDNNNDGIIDVNLNLLNGYVLVDSTAPVIQSSNPVGGSTIMETQQIIIVFNESVRTGTLVAGGTIGISIVSWSTTSTYNDTIILTPATVWNGGTRNLDITVSDLQGNATGTLTLNYSVSDTTAPVITAFSPSVSATGIEPSASVSVLFNEPLDPATVISGNAYIYEGTNVVSSAVTYNASMNEIIITPFFDLAHLTTYTVMVSSNIKDASGNSMMFSASWDFSTRVGTWQSMAGTTAANRTYAATVTDGTYIYTVGGMVNGVASGLLEKYDPETEVVTTLTSMPTARGYARAELVNGKIYVIGGWGGASNYYNIIEEYNIATNTWTNCGGTCATLPWTMYAHATATLNSKIYIFDSSSTHEYNPATNTFTNCGGTCTLNPWGGYTFQSAIAFDGQIHVVGGVQWNGSQYLSYAGHYLFDPVSNSWSSKASITSPRGNIALAVLNNRLYAIGGYSYTWNGSSQYQTISSVNQEYNPVTNTWTAREFMLMVRMHHNAETVNGRIYVLYGETANWSYPIPIVQVYR